MAPVTSARGRLARITALFVTAVLMLPLSVALTIVSATHASASCVANAYSGRWRSSDDRLSRIDVWSGEDCGLYVKVWSTCESDASRDCSWGSRPKVLEGTPNPNFRFVSYTWNNASEVLHLKLQNSTRMSVWDHTEYHSGREVSFTVWMDKDR
ncbi:hypothetical protein ACWCQL_33100 [Streptomyces sp. NPDC002073]|uniref:hypothetical protein n=1 Tax=Streptomyces sp. NBC_00239 TaxID=2903640 RepID=UPI002E2DA0F3|nr:hypothetical protein [Streptomyces sp. NBC_00239]